MTRDLRRAGEGAMKGWATRRRRMADRRVALDRLIEVADSITSDLVVGERAEQPGKYLVGALTLVNWRDRITSALRILDGPAGGARGEAKPAERNAGSPQSTGTYSGTPEAGSPAPAEAPR